jgi:hypothetical protein
LPCLAQQRGGLQGMALGVRAHGFGGFIKPDVAIDAMAIAAQASQIFQMPILSEILSQAEHQADGCAPAAVTIRRLEVLLPAPVGDGQPRRRAPVRVQPLAQPQRDGMAALPAVQARGVPADLLVLVLREKPLAAQLLPKVVQGLILRQALQRRGIGVDAAR